MPDVSILTFAYWNNPKGNIAKCVSVFQGASWNGALTTQWDCDTTSSQTFNIVPF